MLDAPLSSLDDQVRQIVQEDWGRILASLTKSFGDLALAEDCLQDAAEIALQKWPNDGLPQSPAAWLLTTARRKGIDRLRRDRTFARKQKDMAYLAEMFSPETDIDMDAIPDKRLELIFTCCHPALTEKSKIALTLRTIAGLTTEEIAKAFLDAPKTMAQRLARAKAKIRLAGIPYNVPDTSQLPSRMNDVLGVVYLIFNEGYSASFGDTLMRVDLSEEAIRIARILHQLMPDEAEVAGLLALMLLHDSRRYARIDKDGAMISLEDQNRAKWDQAKITLGKKTLVRAMNQQRIGSYQIQACISALHCEAESWAATDWSQIATLYGLLDRMQPSAVVRLNQIAAISYADSVEKALERLGDLQGLENYQPYHALRADLLSRKGDISEALTAYDKAVELTDNQKERIFLTSKRDQLSLL